MKKNHPCSLTGPSLIQNHPLRPPHHMHQSIINNLTVLFLTAAYAVTIGTVWLWCRPW